MEGLLREEVGRWETDGGVKRRRKRRKKKEIESCKKLEEEVQILWAEGGKHY